MAILTVAQLKEQINFDADLGSTDDALLGRKIAAAQGHIERLLGFKIEERFGDEGEEEVPPALVEAVSMLAAHWYENREASLIGISAADLPFGVWPIVNEYREYSFD
jgi:hypothetical protein